MQVICCGTEQLQGSLQQALEGPTPDVKEVPVPTCRGPKNSGIWACIKPCPLLLRSSIWSFSPLRKAVASLEPNFMEWQYCSDEIHIAPDL